MSNYLENKLLDHTLKNTTYTPASTIYLALFTSDPGEDKTGTEVSGGAYARKSPTFATAAAGVSTNNADVLFDVATANWGTISHVAIFDAATAGNMLYYGQLTTSKTINTSDQLKIAAGDLSITLD
jgi:hypothetical protein